MWWSELKYVTHLNNKNQASGKFLVWFVDLRLVGYLSVPDIDKPKIDTKPIP